MESLMEERTNTNGWRTLHSRDHGQNIRSGIHPQAAESQEIIENLTDEMPDKKPHQNRPRRGGGTGDRRQSMVERERRRFEAHNTSHPTT